MIDSSLKQLSAALAGKQVSAAELATLDKRLGEAATAAGVKLAL